MCRRLEINFFFFCRSTLLAPVFRFEHLARFARKKKRHQNGKKGTTKVRRLGGSWGGGGVFAILRKGGWPHPHRTAWGDAHDPARRGKNTKQPKKEREGKTKSAENQTLRETGLAGGCCGGACSTITDFFILPFLFLLPSDARRHARNEVRRASLHFISFLLFC